jgi:hypothetical protein
MKYVALLCLFTTLSFATDAKEPAKVPAVPEVISLRLVAALQKAYIAQNAWESARDAACAKDDTCNNLRMETINAANAYNEARDKATKDMNLPANEELVINLKAKEGDQVMVIHKKD